MLTELSLILGAATAMLAVAATIARVSLRRPSGSSDVRRLAEAASRAAEAFLWRENRIAAAAALGLIVLIVSGHVWRSAVGSERPELVIAGWCVLGVLVGGTATAIVAHLAASIVLRAAAQGASIRSLEDALVSALRAGGALGLFTDALSGLCVGGLFALPFFLDGGTVARGEALGPLLLRAVAALPGFAIGAAAVGLVYQQCGAAHHAASSVGAAVGAERRARLDRDDARNPGLVAGLVGCQVGIASSRAVDAFVLGGVANVAAWMVGASAFASGAGDATWGLVTLPPVARAIAALSSAFGLLAARAERGEPFARALWRGQIVGNIVAIGGVAGASLWLLGNTWMPIAAAAAAGLGGVTLGAHSLRWLARSGSSPAREIAEAARSGPAITISRALAEGMHSAWLPALILGVAVSGAWELGAQGNGAASATLGLATAIATAAGAQVYVLALGMLAPISLVARGLSAVARPGDADRRPTTEMEAAHLEIDTVAQTYFAMLGGATALFTLLAVPRNGTVGDFSASPAVLYAGLLGAVTILAFTGRTLGVAARAARAAAVEAERQLKGFPKEGEVVVVPREFTPTYRLLVDQAAKAASPQVLIPIGTALLVPIALGIALRLLYSSSGLAIQGLGAFVVIASATALATALTVDAARAVLGAAHRSNRPRGTSPGFETSAEGDALADLVGSTAIPGGLLMTKAIATAVLIAAPMLQ